jgi:hypothetical protein
VRRPSPGEEFFIRGRAAGWATRSQDSGGKSGVVGQFENPRQKI